MVSPPTTKLYSPPVSISIPFFPITQLPLCVRAQMSVVSQRRPTENRQAKCGRLTTSKTNEPPLHLDIHPLPHALLKKKQKSRTALRMRNRHPKEIRR